MKNLVLIMLALNLNACRSLKLEYSGEQCSPVFVYVDETQKLIDVDKSFCNVRQYEMNISRVGAINGTSAKMPLPYCDRCMGFKNYSDLVTFAEQVRKEIVEEQGQRVKRFSREVKEPAIAGQD